MRTKRHSVYGSISIPFFLCALILSMINGQANGSVLHDEFQPLSLSHTDYGVAQLNYGNIPGFENSPTMPVMKLMNPTPVTQVAAAIVYEAERGQNPGTPEVYATCVVRKLTPHASIGIPSSAVDTPANTLPKYAEVIWAPVEKVQVSLLSQFGIKSGVKKGARMADGLGGYFLTAFQGSAEGTPQLAHPQLFSLPSDDVVAGQRQAAIDCVLGGLANLGLPADIFEDFGIPYAHPIRHLFTPLSPNHTDYGVAQLNYGNISGSERTGDSERPVIKLMNPVPVRQVAAAIVYESERGRNPGTAEKYLTCAVRELTPHASIGIPTSAVDSPANILPKYAEVIWAPVEKVDVGLLSQFGISIGLKKGIRMADGLGGYFETGRFGSEGDPRLAHPGLFSLPSDDVVAGQRQAAIDCLCDALEDMGRSKDTFKEFGVRCND